MSVIMQETGKAGMGAPIAFRKSTPAQRRYAESESRRLAKVFGFRK